MKIWGLDISVIIVALVTAYIGYQFNHRAKKRETFLKELSVSYNEVYSLMYVELSLIEATEGKEEKIRLIDNFVQEYSGKNSKIRLLASSYLLEYFYNFLKIHLKYKQEENRINEHELFKMVTELFSMIEDEYWNAHDTIYEDHKQFISDTFTNPFFVIFANLFRVIYHLSVFAFWSSIIILYFTVAQLISPVEWFPVWWNIYYSITLVIISIAFFGFMMMFKEMIIKKNRRESKLVKSLKKKTKETILKYRRLLLGH
ncbi:hypothetical protein MHH49_18205 [Paenibacillus sp. FSL F4-0122]|uniref:hypothetical protein n=1 Tax=Paenibacillus sp. FSL F4-0122 TaxID=2921371 RepID=UPI0030F60C74